MNQEAEQKFPKEVQDLFNKGFSALERGNLDYAVNMLTMCVEKQPDFLQARKFLRAAQTQIFKKKGENALTHHISFITGLPVYLRVMMMIKKGKGREALAFIEKLLGKDPYNLKFLVAFANAAQAAELYDVGIQTLEVASEEYSENIAILNLLGAMYIKVGKITDARKCFDQVCTFRPKDLAALKALKDTMALESMASDGWDKNAEEGGSYREMIKDKDEAVLLEQKAKSVRTEKDIEALIIQAVTKIECQPEDMNAYRSLGRLYAEKKAFNQAIEALNKALEINPGDAEIRKAISTTRVQQFDHEIFKLKNAGNVDAANAKELEKKQFIFDELQKDVQRYPNDPRLRFEWGFMLYDNGYVNEAVSEFQFAQKSPQHRVKALYYLGLCFKSKQQYDMAREQFEKACVDLQVMDDTKKAIYYALGELSEAVGDEKSAQLYYKEIYQADIGYMDVAEKVDRAYNG